MELEVGVIGAGSWGTTVASLTSRNAPTRLWARRAEVAEEINRERTNALYLRDARVPRGVVATADIEEAVRGADVVIMGVPSHGFRAVVAEVARHIRPWVPVLSLAKGLEDGTLMRMTQVIDELLPGHPAGVLTGPNLAREIMAGYAAAAVVAMEDETIVKELQALLKTGLFRVYTNRDVIGCELGGALKNVIAIAAGMGDGVGVGDNTRSAVITRGLAELTRLGVAMGGRPRTFAGLAGLGDLVATCTSAQSRNRHVGEQLGRGRKLAEITADMHMVAEGVRTCRVVMQLAQRYGVDMPIAREVFGVVHGDSTPLQAYRGLIRRVAAGSEEEPG